MRFLKNEKQTIAVFYGFGYQRQIINYQVAHDPLWDKYSPGTVLLYSVIEEAFNKGYEEFDFLRGNERYKNTWAKNSRNLFQIIAYNKNTCGTISRWTNQAKEFVKRKVGRSVE